jgi:cytochrome c oxidase subunit 3
LSSGIGASGGNRNRGGGGGNGGNNGGDNQKDDFTEQSEPYSSNKLRIAMWFTLLVVLMTFGGLIGAYIVVATNGSMEWKPFDLPIQIWISTFLILASSLTFKIAQGAINADKQEKAKIWLLATTAFGGMFIASQILAWFELVRRGVYLESNPYAGFFYLLTAVHAVHVFAGIAALGYVVLRTWDKSNFDLEIIKRRQIANAVGWFWHCLDGLWIILFLLLGFWK